MIFLPTTPASSLVEKCREVVTDSGLAFRLVETAGMSLRKQLVKSNPFLSKECGRDDCLKCSSGGKGNCRVMGITYVLTCVTCEAAGETAKYVGQAARSAFTRGKEHWSQLVNGSDQSRMHDHAVERHNGATPEVRMDVTGSYGNDCMLRQISEAVQIRAPA